MSEFDRRSGVKYLRVRGMKAVCFAAVMKAIGAHFQGLWVRKVANRTANTILWGFVGHLGHLGCLWSYQRAIQATFTRRHRTLYELSAESVKSIKNGVLAFYDTINIDETGWKDKGKRCYLWTFVAVRVAFFLISPNGGAKG